MIFLGSLDKVDIFRQLGYLYGEPTERSYFGSVSPDFAFDDVQCRGDEAYIWRCPHDTSHNCGSHEGAGVICSNEGQYLILFSIISQMHNLTHDIVVVGVFNAIAET